jgi:hypothetical protein
MTSFKYRNFFAVPVLMAAFFAGHQAVAQSDDATAEPSQATTTKLLNARGESVVSGVEAELTSTFRARSNGRRQLNGELENINLPVGTKISFCLTTTTQAVPLAVRSIKLIAGKKVAEFEFDTENGQAVPNVNGGYKLRARFGSNGTKPMCNAPLLVSGTYR